MTSNDNIQGLGDKLYCRIRQEWVSAQPEEVVRQRLVEMMIAHLDFPQGIIAVEKNLRQIPHLAIDNQSVPDRRADVICFGKGIHPDYDLYPLLLVECKAVKITDKVITQVVGYNHYLKAYFVAVANDHEIQTGWYDREKKKYTFVQGMPAYPELLSAVTASSVSARASS